MSRLDCPFCSRGSHHPCMGTVVSGSFFSRLCIIWSREEVESGDRRQMKQGFCSPVRKKEKDSV